MATSTTKYAPPPVPSKRMTVDEFETLEDSLGDERIELIDGHVFGRSDMKPAHVLAMGLAKQSVEPMLPVDRYIRKDEPVRIPDFNEPFPDLAVARGNLRTYADRHPGPEDISLAIEVSDTTLDRDRGPKWENYARSGIPVYWIVNLVEHQVEVYTDPTEDGYASRAVFAPSLGTQFVPVVIDGVEVGRINVADILP